MRRRKPYRRYPGDVDTMSCILVGVLLGLFWLVVAVAVARRLL